MDCLSYMWTNHDISILNHTHQCMKYLVLKFAILASVCIPTLVTTFPSGSAVQTHVSILVVFVVFWVHMHSFAGLIRRTPPPTFSDTAITDRHSDTTFFQLRVHWVWISWSTGLERSFGHVPPLGVEPSTSCVQGEHPIH